MSNLKKENDNNNKIDKYNNFQDYSTFLYNRNYFIKNINSFALQMIKGEIENRINNNCDKTWSIMYCDIDGLKLANDTIGHIEADDGIKHIADIIKKNIRSNRSPSDEIILANENEKNIPIRVGGDEFIIILPNCTKNKAEAIENRIKNQISNDQDKTKNMSLSIGLADTSEIKIPSDIENNNVIKDFLTELISLAEKRMYINKKKDIRLLPYEEQKAVVHKYINRMTKDIGLDINSPKDIDLIIDILNDIKKKKKENRTR